MSSRTIILPKRNLKSLSMNSNATFARNGTLKIKWTEPDKNIHYTGKCAIVVPIYKPIEALSKFEHKSIERTVSIFGKKYEIILVCGKSFNCSAYDIEFGHDFSYCKLSDDFFQSQKSYSDLCESFQFYEVFEPYEYILICQTDAWVFEDRLDYFIDLGYDYIGSIHMLRANGNGGKVGNGGFSLRKVSKFVDVCKKTDFEQFKFSLLEDCVFTIRLKNEFNIAPENIGFDFGWQEQPQAAYAKTKKLPMGCHNPMKNNWNFWRNYIKISDEEFNENGAKALVGDVDFSIKPKYNVNVTPKKPVKKIY